jgi:hypothetical protein
VLNGEASDATEEVADIEGNNIQREGNRAQGCAEMVTPTSFWLPRLRFARNGGGCQSFNREGRNGEERNTKHPRKRHHTDIITLTMANLPGDLTDFENNVCIRDD